MRGSADEVQAFRGKLMYNSDVYERCSMSEQMVRKQIYLPRRQNLALRRLAKERGVSEAEVIRQALEREAEAKAIPLLRGTDSWAGVLDFLQSRRIALASGGKPLEWDRQAVHEERENRWIKPESGE
jgi:hypothetical protein